MLTIFRRRRRVRGAAMIETVLVLPVVLVVLVLLLGVGRSMLRWQQVSVMDRYEAGRQVAGAPGPANGVQLNEAFLAGQAIDLELRQDNGFPAEPTRLLVTLAGWHSLEAGELADRVTARLPDGRRVHSQTTFESVTPLEARVGLAGPLRHTYVRLNHEWKFVNGQTGSDGRWSPGGRRASNSNAIVDYLYDRWAAFQRFEDQLEAMQSHNTIAAEVRRMYLREPGYRGPSAGLD